MVKRLKLTPLELRIKSDTNPLYKNMAIDPASHQIVSNFNEDSENFPELSLEFKSDEPCFEIQPSGLDDLIQHTSGILHHQRPIYEMTEIPSRQGGRNNSYKVGKLEVILNDELGRGSDGTIVYEGFYERAFNGKRREVAVKRMIKNYQHVASKESENLIMSDNHPNIIRWYGVEEDQNFVYIALERCVCSLHDLISSLGKSRERMHKTVEVFKDLKLWEPDLKPSALLLKLIRDTVKGLAHLHELRIIHRDLKPQNVLICNNTYISAKVSDMGISKLLPDGAHSLSKSTSGSSGWKARERLLNKRETYTVDSFSLGCLIFFCITGGEHPFGKNPYYRDRNIIRKKKDLSSVTKIPEAHDLISRLLDHNPESRLQVAAVLNHPLFWDPKKRLDFLKVASDRAEEEQRKLKDRQKQVSAEVPRSGLLDSLESKGPDVFGADWDTKLDDTLLNNLKNTRQTKYIYTSLYSLLRAIRNKLHHYSEELEAAMGTIPEGFQEYFRFRFPKLLMEVYEVLKEHCGKENGFLKYYN